MDNNITLPGRKQCAINLSKLGYSNSIISKATNLSISTISNLIKNRPSTFTRKKRRTIIQMKLVGF
jgi:transposase